MIRSKKKSAYLSWSNLPSSSFHKCPVYNLPKLPPCNLTRMFYFCCSFWRISNQSEITMENATERKLFLCKIRVKYLCFQTYLSDASPHTQEVFDTSQNFSWNANFIAFCFLLICYLWRQYIHNFPWLNFFLSFSGPMKTWN